ncbi:unnamed protein product [Prunus armeniaca]|uniref:Uncharacterized protein n=1 Tax=Prunus armeniaca TaxID=36596 RepID=A0A6J5X0H7_PRUAR|nr:unnamed protein product [Prunus armeniaca]
MARQGYDEFGGVVSITWLDSSFYDDCHLDDLFVSFFLDCHDIDSLASADIIQFCSVYARRPITLRLWRPPEPDRPWLSLAWYIFSEWREREKSVSLLKCFYN